MVVLLIIWTIAGAGRGAAGGEETFAVSCARRLQSYHRNAIAVTAPESGWMTMRVQDEWHVYREVEAEIAAGTQEILWDGLGWNGERLNSKVYQIC